MATMKNLQDYNAQLVARVAPLMDKKDPRIGALKTINVQKIAHDLTLDPDKTEHVMKSLIENPHQMLGRMSTGDVKAAIHKSALEALGSFGQTQQTIPKAVTTPVKQPNASTIPLTPKLQPKPKEYIGGGWVPALSHENAWHIEDPKGHYLQELANNAPQTAIDRLEFAVARHPNTGVPQTFIRKIDGKPLEEKPAELEQWGPLERDRQINNLQMATGRELSPLLRKSAREELLSPKSDQQHFVLPNSNGSYDIHSVPKLNFRPMKEAVEYAVPKTGQWEAWKPSHAFDFEPFTVEGEAPKTTPTTTPPVQTNPVVAAIREAITPTKSAPVVSQPTPTPSAVKIDPSKLEQQRNELQKQLEDPYKNQDRWPELARVESNLGNMHEANLAYANSMWHNPTPELAKEWNDAVNKKDPHEVINDILAKPDVDRLYIEHLIAATVAGADHLDANTANQIRKRIANAGKSVGIKPKWLAETALNRSNPDIVSLAKLRDQLYEKMLKGGLEPGDDLPSFVNQLGNNSAVGNFDSIRQTTPLIHEWIDRSVNVPGTTNPTPTKPLVDLEQALALAKIGNKSEAQEIMNKVEAPKTNVQQFIQVSLKHRIQQAINGEDLHDRLPNAIHQLGGEHGAQRALANIRSIEPLSGIPHEDMTTSKDPNEPLFGLVASNIQLATEKDPNKLNDLLNKTIEDTSKNYVSPNNIDDKDEKANSYGNAYKLALPLLARFGRREDARKLISNFANTTNGMSQNELVRLINRGMSGWASNLRKLNLKNGGELALNQIDNNLRQGKNPEDLIAGKKPIDQANLISAMLKLADGYISFGDQAKAETYLQLAEKKLKDPSMNDQDYENMAQSYLSALTDMHNRDNMQARIHEFFRNARPLINSKSGREHYSERHLKLADEAMRALAGHGSLNGAGKAWADSDEGIVRSKINNELQSEMKKQLGE